MSYEQAYSTETFLTLSLMLNGVLIVLLIASGAIERVLKGDY